MLGNLSKKQLKGLLEKTLNELDKRESSKMGEQTEVSISQRKVEKSPPETQKTPVQKPVQQKVGWMQWGKSLFNRTAQNLGKVAGKVTGGTTVLTKSVFQKGLSPMLRGIGNLTYTAGATFAKTSVDALLLPFTLTGQMTTKDREAMANMVQDVANRLVVDKVAGKVSSAYNYGASLLDRKVENLENKVERGTSKFVENFIKNSPRIALGFVIKGIILSNLKEILSATGQATSGPAFDCLSYVVVQTVLQDLGIKKTKDLLMPTLARTGAKKAIGQLVGKKGVKQFLVRKAVLKGLKTLGVDV